MGIIFPNIYYLDLILKGGLSKALQKYLFNINSRITLNISNKNYVHIEDGKKQTQIFIAKYKRLFSIDFWENHIQFGKSEVRSLKLLSNILKDWIDNNKTLYELNSKYKIIQIDREYSYFIQGVDKYIRNQWKINYNEIISEYSQFKEILDLLQNNDYFKNFLPKTSHDRLFFEDYFYNKIKEPFKYLIIKPNDSVEYIIIEQISIDNMKILYQDSCINIINKYELLLKTADTSHNRTVTVRRQ